MTLPPPHAKNIVLRDICVSCRVSTWARLPAGETAKAKLAPPILGAETAVCAAFAAIGESRKPPMSNSKSGFIVCKETVR